MFPLFFFQIYSLFSEQVPINNSRFEVMMCMKVPDPQKQWADLHKHPVLIFDIIERLYGELLEDLDPHTYITAREYIHLEDEKSEILKFKHITQKSYLKVAFSLFNGIFWHFASLAVWPRGRGVYCTVQQTNDREPLANKSERGFCGGSVSTRVGSVVYAIPSI